MTIGGWIFGLDRGIAEAHEGANLRIPRVFQFVIKYVAPIYLVVLIVGFCWQAMPGYLAALRTDHDAQRAWLVIGATVIGLVVITVLGAKRWRAQGLDLDGKLPAQD